MKQLFSFLLIFFLIQIYLSAQQSDSVKTTLSEIVVTANRTETPYYTLGSSVSVITSEEISKQNLRTVVDVLREMPGLTIAQQGGPGKLANVFMRGTNPNHTLVIMDGIVMNDPSSVNNAFDFSYLNTNDIDRIEVVRGPQSTLYGSDAIGGVINIITKRGGGKPQFSFLGETGSYGLYRGNISVLGSFGILNYAISAARSSDQGVSAAGSIYGNKEKDGYMNNSFTSQIGIDLLKNLSMDLFYKFTNAKTDLDQNGKYGDDPNFISNIEEQIFRGGIKLSLLNGNWQQSFNASLVKHFNHSLDLPDQFRPTTSSDGYYRAQRNKFDWQNNLRFIENNLITFGIESSTEEAYTSYYSTSDYGLFDNVFPNQSIGTTGVYLQDQFNYENALFISAGLRSDNNQKFGNVSTYRIAPAYYINSTNTKLKMSFGTGFKAPSLFYLYDPTFGNPELKPEKSKGWDFGFEQYFENGHITFGATYFNLNLEDMFGYGPDYREINIAKASSHGLELTASFSLYHNFSFIASYTYTKTKNEYNDPGNPNDYNEPLLRRPENQASFSLNYRFSEKLDANLQIIYTGKRWDKDFTDAYNPVRVEMPDYTIINLSASYKLFDFVKLNARIENLFDKQYEDVLYYGTLGRSLYAGLNINL